MEFVIFTYLIIGVVVVIVHMLLVDHIGHGWYDIGPTNLILSGLLWPYTIGAWIYYFIKR